MTVAHEEGYSDDEPEDDFEVDGEVDDDYDFLDNDLFTSEVGQAASLPATASPLAPFDTPSAFNEQPVFSAPLLPVAPTEEQSIPIPPSGSVQVLQTSTTKLFEAMTASLGGRQSLRNIISSALSIPKTTKERHRTGKKDPFRIPVRSETFPGGIAEAFARHRLSVGTVKVPFHGTKQLAENTLPFYQKHMRGIQYFCAIIGDYDSLLMLLEEPPTPVCPSMKPSTLASFIRFKRFPPGTLLVDADNNPVRDVFGN
ncbi:hypothetical protein DFJ73DRAFT_489403 [Zopfochytrium polystomum]|nr:hypothetical protein DFJ73DRAFT_489403 [Zopfochytrium polystomum]